jgi:hypothetical protein
VVLSIEDSPGVHAFNQLKNRRRNVRLAGEEGTLNWCRTAKLREVAEVKVDPPSLGHRQHVRVKKGTVGHDHPDVG